MRGVKITSEEEMLSISNRPVSNLHILRHIEFNAIFAEKYKIWMFTVGRESYLLFCLFSFF